MEFIHHKEIDTLHIFSDFPSPWQDVPDLWSTDDDVTLWNYKQ